MIKHYHERDKLAGSFFAVLLAFLKKGYGHLARPKDRSSLVNITSYIMECTRNVFVRPFLSHCGEECSTEPMVQSPYKHTSSGLRCGSL